MININAKASNEKIAGAWWLTSRSRNSVHINKSSENKSKCNCLVIYSNFNPFHLYSHFHVLGFIFLILQLTLALLSLITLP